jgi:hypothetical protein
MIYLLDRWRGVIAAHAGVNVVVGAELKARESQRDDLVYRFRGIANYQGDSSSLAIPRRWQEVL